MARIIEGYMFMTAEEAGLGPEHYAGCDEACREIEAEPLSDEDALRIANLYRSRERLPPLTWEEFKGENNSDQS